MGSIITMPGTGPGLRNVGYFQYSGDALHWGPNSICERLSHLCEMP